MPRRRWSFWMTPLEHTSILWMDDVYRGLLTPTGRVLLWAAVAAGVLLLGGLVPSLVVAFAFCASALLCAFAVGLLFRPRLSLTRHLPPPPTAGGPLVYRVTVRNVGRRVARSVVVEERGLPPEVRPLGEPPVIPQLAPGESVEVALGLLCHKRGAWTLRRLQGASTFPSALVKWGCHTRAEDRLLVYPRCARLTHFEVPHGRNYQPGGIAVASQVGESTEFVALRDWREGDRLRDVAWPAYARTGRLVVRESQEEYFVRLALVLDVEARSAREEKRLEEALSLAAGIADALARQEYILDVFAAGPRVYHLQAGRALAHVEHLLELLACLEPGDGLDVSALEAALAPEAARLSAVVFVLMDWDEARASLVERLKGLGVAVRVLCLHPAHRPTGLPPEEVLALP